MPLPGGDSGPGVRSLAKSLKENGIMEAARSKVSLHAERYI